MRIVEDEKDTMFVNSKRQDVENVLVLTGGGMAQTFFALGACGCLYDNGMLEHDSFDLISVVSGGSMLGSVLELCYLYQFDLDPDTDNWFNKYVREGALYAAVKSKVVAKWLSYGGDVAKTEKYLFDKYLPLYKRDADLSKLELRGPRMEYNVVDMDALRLTTDHSDVFNYDDTSVERDPLWYAIRPARCGVPITNFKGRPIADAGAISNTPVTTIYERYNITNRVIVIKNDSKVQYDKYAKRSFRELIDDYVFTIIRTSRDSISDMVDRLNAPEVNTRSFMISSSNSLNQSKDPFHNGMINDSHYDEINYALSTYVGLLIQNDDYMRILENEGYIQAYHALKERGLVTSEFRIPNPEYYNENVKSKWEAIKALTTQDVIFDYLNTLFETFVETILE